MAKKVDPQNNPCFDSISKNEQCEQCTVKSSLMCTYDPYDSLHFFMIFLPFFVTAIGGIISIGFGWWLTAWLAYMIFFFFGWEARVLCSHCPYWAKDGGMLRCHANYGILKIWRYRPEPMSRSEQIQFLAGALILILIPVVILIAGGGYLLAAICLVSGISFGYLLHRNICGRCVNFSCPLNHAPREVMDEYLRMNQVMREAWKKHRPHITNNA